MDNKTDLRIWAKSIRKTLMISDISHIITYKIRQNPLYKNAKNVLIFYPTKYELNLLTLLDDDKNFYLPKVNGENIFVCPFKKGDLLKISDFNIKEPCNQPVGEDILDLVIVPALAADNNGFRLGYGGGFYDRFLSKHKIKSIVPIAKELLIEKLPVDVFDIPVDCVITD